MAKVRALTSGEQFYVYQLKRMLARLEIDNRVDPKMIGLGAMANALKEAHPSKSYNKSHDFLRGRGKVEIEEAGWLVVKEKGQLQIKKTCRAIEANTYLVCNKCRIRVQCLEKGQRPQLAINLEEE